MQAIDANLIPLSRLERAAEVLRVLAHPHRLRICELLMQGRVSVGAIAEHLKIPQNAASQHLNIMKAHGILGAHREGKTVYYEVVDPRPAWLLGCIREHPVAESGLAGVPTVQESGCGGNQSSIAEARIGNG
ncbi:MAG TPA: metalloregulator ArsR/SmtB family transcription factor [Phycisphaerae bacterium]|nr:metalloregulator ArsR/SmtB family transcription factor [Phycisphaerae bacterium]